MDLMNMFQQQMTGAVVNQIAQKVGLGGNEQQTSQAAQNIFSTLMGAVSKNAATPQGAEALNKALDNDHDGGIMDNLMSFLSPGPTENVSERATNGSGILKHMLGNKEQGIVQGLSKMNNMSPDATQSMMQTIAPMVMGMLGQAKQKQGFDASSITQFLGGQQQPQSNNQLSGLMSMLDSDGDGNIMDDIGGMLGGMFGK
ncbi:DUF937 domain-containing protein [Aureispira anguillae]|uniref:DUF937 domain-containing protein n=1 Tax=Aureispira anguillae TaxID=2864201 RepID=A0A915YI02_9BACT|nr:DUF937 domain-containing protein [Aureispira anguillae]BDS13410.1 DUF937 domain-containing protein [Aureispira anguillae]